MGGGGKKVNTALMDQSLARQEDAIRRQEDAVTKREEELRTREEARKEATRRARGARGGSRAVLLGGTEAGTFDQPLPAGVRRLLGG